MVELIIVLGFLVLRLEEVEVSEGKIQFSVVVELEEMVG